MKRIVTKAFTLNRPEGLTAFSVGDDLNGADADHWYAQAHSKEVDEATAPAAVEEVVVPVVAETAVEVVAEQPQAEVVEPEVIDEATAPAKAGKKK